ncbi:MAG: AAC(3) family N-acetyltransferase [Ignavibacteria bacterium]|nr:AAC(3) family N-acetyltransferase [Ignavibacteria bacterium]
MRFTDADKDKTVSELASWWRKSGIEKGDTMLLHSSLSGFLKYLNSININITPQDILDSFIEAIGNEGTLILPVFNFNFTKGETYDIRNTKSETGLLTETARLNKNFIRTGHPMFSFVVTGKLKDEFGRINNISAFGSDSPFAKLTEHNGKIAALDIPGELCNTYIHYVEECEQAPHRFFKFFKGKYIDAEGKESIREYAVYSRKLEMGVKTDIKPMEDYLWSMGFYSGSRPGEDTRLHVIKARTFYEEVSKIIREGKAQGMLFTTAKNN